MRKFIKLAFCSFGVFMVSVFATTNTWAVVCLQASLSDGPYIGEMVDHTCCDALDTTRYYLTGVTNDVVSVTSCSTCKGRADPIIYDINGLVNPNGSVCEVLDVRRCEDPGCSNCTSTSWEPYGEGYERKQTATCECGACTRKYAYRCAAGYYGLPLNGTSGCSPCPTVCDGVSTTSAAGATNSSQCCASIGATGSDTTGSFKLTDAVCAEGDL
jgi:hypothetical protein